MLDAIEGQQAMGPCKPGTKWGKGSSEYHSAVCILCAWSPWSQSESSVADGALRKPWVSIETGDVELLKPNQLHYGGRSEDLK